MATVLDHLGQVCRQARERADLRQLDIATAAGVSHGTVSRFETLGAGAPRELDHVVDAYASECRVDALELWTDALVVWREERDA